MRGVRHCAKVTRLFFAEGAFETKNGGVKQYLLTRKTSLLHS